MQPQTWLLALNRQPHQPRKDKQSMAITSQGQDALAERSEERQKVYLSGLDDRSLHSLRSSDDAYEKVIQAAMRLDNNSPQQ